MLFEVIFLFTCSIKNKQLFQNSRDIPQDKTSLLRTFYTILETSLGGSASPKLSPSVSLRACGELVEGAAFGSVLRSRSTAKDEMPPAIARHADFSSHDLLLRVLTIS